MHRCDIYTVFNGIQGQVNLNILQFSSKVNKSTVSGFMRFLIGVTVLPDAQKSCSEDESMAQTHKYFLARFVR